MKNKIYIVLLLAMWGWACSEKKEIAPERTKYEVSFAVSEMPLPGDLASSTGVQQTAQNSKAQARDDNSALYIYNSKGDLVAEAVRCCSLNEPILISGLEKGMHTAVAVGRVLDVGGAGKLSTARSINMSSADLYIDKVEFNVDPVETDVVNLVMKRKVGMLKVEITDEPTNDVFFVRANIHSVASEYFFETFVAVGNDHTTLFTSGSPDANGDFVGYFLVPGNSKSYKTSVSLELVDHNWNVIKTQLIKDVTVGTNMKTTLRGKFYHSNPQGFTMEVDDLWSGEDLIDF